MKRLETELRDAVNNLRVKGNSCPWMKDQALLDALDHALALVEYRRLKAENAAMSAKTAGRKFVGVAA